MFQSSLGMCNRKCDLSDKKIMKMDYPVGIVLFLDSYEFSQAVAYCHDFNIDAVDIFLYTYHCILFFDNNGLTNFKQFSDNNSFSVIYFGISSVHFRSET